MRILVIVFTSAFILSSCSLWERLRGSDKENFINTYKEILVTRELYPDTSKANRKVESIMKNHGYTHESFKEEYFRFAEDSEEFIKLIDSARSLAKDEIIKIELKKNAKKKK